MTDIDIINEVQQNFIDSSYDVNANRAFPNVKDGCKVGQRCCLWEMYRKGYSSTRPHVKSAKISGGVAAALHPHGTQAIYETFARMSQPFSNNNPEVDFHGANGNIILGGDAYAADRYTEARLSPLAEQGMFRGIDKDNVPMVWNFSEDELMPQVLPAVFPRLLVNGCQGLGVGVANYWALHNLAETGKLILSYLKTGKLKADSYYPDFPTGGTIVNKDDLPQINETGRGKIVLRANYRIEGKEIIFYEMPYQVYIEPVIEKIKELVEKGGLAGIKQVINKCDKEQINLTVVCKNKDVVERTLAELLAYTPLCTQINVNQNGIISKTPVLLNLRQTIDVYIEHNLECILREYEFDLRKTQEKAEILEGLVIALDNVDEVVGIIKKSESSVAARGKLIEKYGLTEAQAKAIMDMRLSKLAHLEKDEIKKELADKKSYMIECEEIIEDQNKRKEVLMGRLSDLIKKFGLKRRTQVIQEEVKKPEIEVAKDEGAKPKDVVVLLNQDGYLKSVPFDEYKTPASNEYVSCFKASMDSMVLLLSNKGKLYRQKVESISQCGMKDKGLALGSVLALESGERVLGMFKPQGTDIVSVTAKGFVKRTNRDTFVGNTASVSGISAMALGEGDEIVKIMQMTEDIDNFLIVGTQEGRFIKFNIAEVASTGRGGKGVRVIAFKDSSSSSALVSDAILAKAEDEVLLGAEKYVVKDIAECKRASRGKKICDNAVKFA